MDRIAQVRRMMYATLPISYRIKVGLVDLLAGMRESWFRSAVNKAISEEFGKLGIPLDGGIDFFEIVHRAVLKRLSPSDPDYDDFFQEIMMGFVDRKSGVLQRWVRGLKKMQESGHVNVKAYLTEATKNYVKDMHDKHLRYVHRHVQIRPSGGDEDDSGGGIDLERHSPGSEDTHESGVSAQELYNLIQKNLKDDRSKSILKAIVELGVKGFLRGKGLTEVARELGASPTMTSYYREKVFKPDLMQALKSIGDESVLERAKEVFASTAHPPVAILCRALASMSAAA